MFDDGNCKMLSNTTQQKAIVDGNFNQLLYLMRLNRLYAERYDKTCHNP